jgi:calcineurin-like phosphoesterase family protein
MLLLHISDIHFRHGEVGAPDDPNKALRNDMVRDVRYMRDKIGRTADLILLSGDIAYAGQEKEYNFAYKWLEEELCPAAGCAIENIFVIPGNHDVDIKAEAGPASLHARKSLRSLPPDQVDNELRKWLRDPDSARIIFRPIENYNRFAAKFLCSIGPYTMLPDGSIAKDTSYPFTTRDVELDDGSLLRLWGFNSVIVSDLSDKKDTMLVDPASSQIIHDDGVVHLVMCHHPFNWLRNGGPFEGRINDVTKIQLFGHEHTLRVDEGKYYVRIRAGALQPDRDDNAWKPGYNWIDVSTETKSNKRHLLVKIRVRMHEQNRFLAVPDRHGDEVWSERFELPDWQRPTIAPQPITAAPDAPPAAELPMTAPGPSATVRMVTLKLFRLREHEQRRLIAKMTLDREGDRDLRDYEIATIAVRRANEAGVLDRLDAEIDALLSQGGR